MTTGLMLGTSLEKEELYKKVSECGFKRGTKILGHYVRLSSPPSHVGIDHISVKDLNIEITKPNYFWDMPDIKSAIQYDDYSGRFPDNPEAVKVLEDMLNKIPDLVYRESCSTDKPSPIIKVADYLKQIKNTP